MMQNDIYNVTVRRALQAYVSKCTAMANDPSATRKNAKAWRDEKKNARSALATFIEKGGK